MRENIAESIYYGGLYAQIALFGALMVMLTLPLKKSKKTAAVQWGGVILGAFVLGFCLYYGTYTIIQRLDSIADSSSSNGVIQFIYSLITVTTVFLHTAPALLVMAAVDWIHSGKRSTKIFVSVLFMLVVAAVSQFFTDITYIFFSDGNDGYSRYAPSTAIKSAVDFAWLLCILLIYRKTLCEKLKKVLNFAEEQIAHIILVPCLGYVVFESVKGTLTTYGITLMSVDPGSFLIAVTVVVSIFVMYFLMYWAIFKAVTVAAGSAKVKAELDVASKIQLSALPNKFPAFPKRKEIDIYATMHPAKEVGGDFYDFFFVDKDHLAVLIADVSGKGVPAALFMMSGRAIIRNQALLGMEPGEIFINSNVQLAENNKEGMFITAFLGIMDVNTGEMKFCNAGHNVPYLCREDGAVEALKMNPGFVLAGLKKTKFHTEKVTLQKHEKLVLYTDGVTEAVNTSMEMYMEPRLEDTLKNCCTKPVRETVEQITESVHTFADGAEQADDITILVVERV